MQTTYSAPNAKTYRGDIVSQNKRIKSAPALEKIKFGSVVGFVGTTMSGLQNPSPNKFTFSGSLGASNVCNLNVTVKTISNGVEVSTTTAISPVTYATSHAATMTAIKDAIELAATSVTATVDTNSITVVDDNGAVVILDSVAITGGSAVTVTYDFDGTILGVAQRQPTELNDDGTAYIAPSEMVGAMTQGIMTIYSHDAMNLGSSLYAQFIEATGYTRGEIRTSTASSKAKAFSTLKPYETVSSGNLANVEINNP